MSNKQALRDLQTRLADRLQAAKTQERGEAWLAVECGTHGFLFPLREAGEIFPMTVIAPVPHSHRWFLGVANLRGHLHGVVDLADFLGVKATAALRDQCRLVCFSQSLGINCALMVDRLAGLRSESQMTPQPDQDMDRPAFAGQRFLDVDGRVWQELNLAELAGEEVFLRVVN